MHLAALPTAASDGVGELHGVSPKQKDGAWDRAGNTQAFHTESHPNILC